jgi:phosphatidylglycerol:prolipoprotein diacylglycerol transferase
VLPLIYRFTFESAGAKAVLYLAALGLVLYAAWNGWRAGEREHRLERALAYAVGAVVLCGFLLSYVLPEVPLLGRGRGEGLPIHTYGLLIGAGFTSAITVAAWLAQREWPGELGLTRRAQLFDLSFFLFLSAMVGSRALFILVNWNDYAQHPARILDVSGGGLVFQGGLLAATATGYWYAKRHHIEFARLADLALPTVSLGAAFGRLGCFSAGCCWGKVRGVGSALAVQFPGTNATDLFGNPSSIPSLAFASQRDDPHYVLEATGEVFTQAVPGAVRIADWATQHGHTLPVHPTQLYESAAQVLLFVVFIALRPLRRFHGQIAGLWLMAYAIERSTVELFRGDLERGTIHGLLEKAGLGAAVPDTAWYNISTSQLGSVFIFLGGALVLQRSWQAWRAQPGSDVDGLTAA